MAAKSGDARKADVTSLKKPATFAEAIDAEQAKKPATPSEKQAPAKATKQAPAKAETERTAADVKAETHPQVQAIVDAQEAKGHIGFTNDPFPNSAYSLESGPDSPGVADVAGQSGND